MYVQIVEFPSYEDAMANSELPETSAFAKQLTELCDKPIAFRNLDVRRSKRCSRHRSKEGWTDGTQGGRLP